MRLTARQTAVLQAIADSNSIHDAAKRLGITEDCVRSHLANAARRLGTQGYTATVLASVRQGYVSLTPQHERHELKQHMDKMISLLEDILESGISNESRAMLIAFDKYLAARWNDPALPQTRQRFHQLARQLATT